MLHVRTMCSSNKPPQCCLIFRQSGVDAVGTLSGALLEYEALRGLVALALGFQAWSMSSPPRRFGKYGPARWGLARANKDVAVPIRFDGEPDPPDHKAKPLRLSQEQIDAIRRAAKLVSQVATRNSLDKVILTALGLYGYAMEQHLPHRQILAFWQVAEAVTLARRHGGDSRRVCKRMAYFFRALEIPGMRDLFESIADKRNGIVHAALHDEANQEDATILKLACDRAIAWLLDNKKRFSTSEQLEQFYELSGRGARDLDTLAGAIALIRAKP